ncbi:MAG: hypothetical protein ACJ8AK_16305 [Gemmatimonadaceae bacterium]
MAIDTTAYQTSEAPSWEETLSKVPRVTLVFWVVKVLATTLGETGGDALSMQLNLGYAVSTLIFLGFFIVTLIAQVGSGHYHPVFYWAVVVATTTVGTTTSDYIDRTLKVGYVRSSFSLLALVIIILVVWRVTTGRIVVDRVTNRTDEVFYWVTILVSNTLGTALGDYVADTLGFGFERGALIFTALILIVAGLHFFSRLPTSVTFWAAYVLTRPLGATLGDLLTKPNAQGGLNISRIAASVAIAVLMVVMVAATGLRKRAPRSTVPVA